mmetsp:Transcript_15744/g.20789  ORF Transcript_15744/g.20789 Transcript_15744/m.20789 type:complete len:138 (+) Transcript_15744:70-483(+)
MGSQQKYFCGYCEKSFVDGYDNRRIHRMGKGHKLSVKQWFQQFDAPGIAKGLPNQLVLQSPAAFAPWTPVPLCPLNRPLVFKTKRRRKRKRKNRPRSHRKRVQAEGDESSKMTVQQRKTSIFPDLKEIHCLPLSMQL